MSEAEPISAEPAEEPTSALDVAGHIKARIRSGHLAPGQRLIEADIMRETQASRGRVREALQRLIVEGLVVQQEFRGASVKRLTREEVDQNYRVREMLESLCASLMAERGAPEALAELSLIQTQMNAAENEGDNDAYGTLNERWHELIIGTAGNAYARSLLEQLRIPIFRIQFRRMFSRKALMSSNASHRLITAAILARDPEEAERQMRVHIRDAMQDFANTSDDQFGP